MTGSSPTARTFQPSADASYKLIYLARRHPSIAPADFPAAWRAHSALASTFAETLGSHFRSVRQCVRDPADDMAAMFGDVYDGSSILAMRSWTDLMAARYHPNAIDELAKDEQRVFAGPVDDWTMAVEEEVVRDGPTDSHALLSFLTPQAALDAETFAAQSRARLHGIADDAPAATRIVWNRVIDPARAYPFAAVTELWYPDREAMIVAARTPAIVRYLGQHDVADPDRSVHVLARLNLDKTVVRDSGAARWAGQ